MTNLLKFPIAVVLSLFLATSLVFAQTAEKNTYVKYMKKGAEQLQAGDYPAAREAFEQALKYNDAAYDGHLGLGIAYFHLREDAYAERELTRAVELNPKEITAYRFLGELFYRKDDLDAAASYWEKAVELDPSAAPLRARLDRISKERNAEKDFNRDVTSHFLAKYEGREKIEAGRIVLRILEDAYGEVGRALSFYPEGEMQVVLYSGKQFQEVTDAPGWSNGVFDGKIRIPIGGIEQETPGLRKLLYHEYAHAVVRTITPHCPTWLNEGLAQHFEGATIDARQRELLRKLALAEKLPSLADLEGPFIGLDATQAGYAYLFSLSSVKYMIESFGMYRVVGVLEELARGKDARASISNGLVMPYEEFERGWRKSLE